MTALLLIPALALFAYSIYLYDVALKTRLYAEKAKDKYETALATAIENLAPLTKAKNRCSEGKSAYAKLQDTYKKSLTELRNKESKLARYIFGAGTMDSAAYKITASEGDLPSLEKELVEVKARIKILVKAKKACFTEYSNDVFVNGKRSEAKKLFNREIKLRLRCFDNEVKASLEMSSWNNINRLIERLNSVYNDTNASGKIVKTYLTPEYLAINISLVKLTYEIKQIKTDIKEQEREEKRLSREAEREEKKIQEAAKKAEEARKRMEELVEKELSKLDGATREQRDTLELHQQELEILKEREARSVSMAQLTKSGYVYVISNPSSFGAGVTKIGMTRRLNPHDRVKELGDASVPEFFDVHAFYFTENAPLLEKRLHEQFSDQRVNLVNKRKEFFFVDPEEVLDTVGRIETGVAYQRVDPEVLLMESFI